MLLPGGFTFPNFLADVFSIFIFVLWFWLLITIFGDLFRRHDISGWGKAIWVIVLILFSYIGIFIYLITQHRGMAERQLSSYAVNLTKPGDGIPYVKAMWHYGRGIAYTAQGDFTAAKAERFLSCR